jgi:hypothetical protein
MARLTISTLAQLERHQAGHYERLLLEAPGRDRAALQELQNGTMKRLAGLT